MPVAKPLTPQEEEQALATLAQVNDPFKAEMAGIKEAKPSIGSRLAQAGVGIGEALQSAYGGRPAGLQQQIIQQREADKQQALSEVEQRRREAVKEYFDKQAEEARKKEAEEDRGFRKSLQESQQDFTARQNELNRNADARIQAQVAANKLTNEQADRIRDLRKEVQGKDTYKAATSAIKGLNIVKQFSKNPSGFTDYGSLMAALKALQGDQSVIREAELKQGINATSLLNKAENFIQRGIDGKSLQPEQRQQIIDSLAIVSNSVVQLHKDDVAPIMKQVSALGLPQDQIFVNFRDMYNVKPIPKKKATQQPPGTVHMISRGGQSYFIPKDQVDQARKDGLSEVTGG